MSLIESPSTVPLAGAALANVTSSAWTEERVAALRRYWQVECMSASQVAYALGGFEHCVDGGRSAVIGKAHRLKFAKRGPPRINPAKPRAKAQSRHVVTHMMKRRAEAMQAFPVDAPPEAAPVIFSATPCALLDLTDDTCRFPIGDPGTPRFAFCGGMAVSGLPYCGGHCRIAYQAPAARRDRRPLA